MGSLEWAFWSGNATVETGVNPNIPDCDGETPLFLAATRGHNLVVKLLLEQEYINPDIPNKNGRTPLSVASKKRHKAVMKILQARQSAN